HKTCRYCNSSKTAETTSSYYENHGLCVDTFQYPLKPVIPDPERPCPTPSWEASLKVMSSGAFLNNLQVFPKDNINDEMVELMEPYITMADYTLESAIKTCGQVAGLLSWTLAISSFFAVNKEVLPLKILRDALDSIYDACIPKIWQKVSWDSSSLGFWFTELLERNNQFSNWIFKGRPNCFWMTGFFNPQGFLTAMRQEVTVKDAPKKGVYVYGLFLDGASWDKKNSILTEPPPKVLFTPLPVVYIYAINSTDPKDPALYQCPVYKKSRRTDLTYITPLWLETIVNPNHWILRGVALLCDIK
ncbi:dynein heavy chain 8, axonemal, partial [Trichonephila clavipes]